MGESEEGKGDSVKQMLILLLLGTATAMAQQTGERLDVFLTSECSDNSTGVIVESSFRESVRASSGYRLAERNEPGVFMIALACVNAGQAGEGWTAVAYSYGMVMKANPEKLGISLWKPTLGVFTVGAPHAESKGKELFARFDSELHRQ
jgi:hypothetical protein